MIFKEVMVKWMETGESVKVWMYVYNWALPEHSIRIPSGDYVEYVTMASGGGCLEQG